MPIGDVQDGAEVFRWWEAFWTRGIPATCLTACPVLVKTPHKDGINLYYCVTDQLTPGIFRTPYGCGLVAETDKKGNQFVAVYTYSSGETGLGGEDDTLGLKISCSLASVRKIDELEIAVKGALAKSPLFAVHEKREAALLPGHAFRWKRDELNDGEARSEWTYWKSFGRSSLRENWYDRYIIEIYISTFSDEEPRSEVYVRGMIYATKRNIENELKLPDSNLRDRFRQSIIMNIQSNWRGSRCTNV
jgi:hypothetical protein